MKKTELLKKAPSLAKINHTKWEWKVLGSHSPIFFMTHLDWILSPSWESGSYNDLRDRMIFTSPAYAAAVIERWKRIWG